MNHTNDAFVFKNIKDMIKTLKSDSDTNPKLIQLLRRVEELNHNEKVLKKEIKQGEEELHIKTKSVIENLSDEQVRSLLHEKWARAVEEAIMGMADEMLRSFTKRMEALTEKYAVTMSDIENEIRQTERSLSEMLCDLMGSEADMEGIKELRLLLRGTQNE